MDYLKLLVVLLTFVTVVLVTFWLFSLILPELAAKKHGTENTVILVFAFLAGSAAIYILVQLYLHPERFLN